MQESISQITERLRGPAVPDLRAIASMEGERDQLEALTNVFLTVLEQDHKLSAERATELLADVNFPANDFELVAAWHWPERREFRDSSEHVKFKKRHDSKARTAGETVVSRVFRYLNNDDRQEYVPCSIIDVDYQYASNKGFDGGPFGDWNLIRSTRAELTFHGPLFESALQTVRTNWYKSRLDDFDRQLHQTTHEISASYIGETAQSAHIIAYDGDKIAYLAQAGFTDGQMTGIHLFDMHSESPGLKFKYGRV